jgi:DNA-binding transcriptional regulator GbsR (MarR family)
MFGMEKKPKEMKSFVFDLEKELASEERRRDLAKRIESRIQRIKDVLHKGSKKEEFDQLGILLNGYHALAIVLGRAIQEPKRKKSS